MARQLSALFQQQRIPRKRERYTKYACSLYRGKYSNDLRWDKIAKIRVVARASSQYKYARECSGIGWDQVKRLEVPWIPALDGSLELGLAAACWRQPRRWLAALDLTVHRWSLHSPEEQHIQQNATLLSQTTTFHSSFFKNSLLQNSPMTLKDNCWLFGQLYHPDLFTLPQLSSIGSENYTTTTQIIKLKFQASLRG